MLSCEVKINGILINYIYTHNAEMLSDDIARYEYEVYICNKGIRRGEVKHYRKDGSLQLLSMIIEDLLKRGKKDGREGNGRDKGSGREKGSKTKEEV
jgi:hypothetical protein